MLRRELRGEIERRKFNIFHPLPEYMCTKTAGIIVLTPLEGAEV
jgi:hypothetical protein